MSHETFVWASAALIVTVNLALFWFWLRARDRFKAARAKRQRLYMLHNAHPVFTGEITVSGKRYKITPFYVNCYIIQSPEPPVSLQKTKGILDADRATLDSKLCIVRLMPGILVEPALYCFILQNFEHD